MSKIETNLNRFTCEKCGQGYPTEYQLEFHKQACLEDTVEGDS